MSEEKNAEMTWTLKRSAAAPEKLDKLKMIYGLAVLAALIYGFATRSFVLPVIGLVVIFASTYEFIGGRTFVLNEKTARAGVNEIFWTVVKSVHVRNDEIYLSPFEQESKLDAFRGVKLDVRNVSKESVLAFIRERVGENVRFLGE